jgi:hypothetical protein
VQETQFGDACRETRHIADIGTVSFLDSDFGKFHGASFPAE